MYIIINKTTNESVIHKGNFPCELLDDMVLRGDKVIIISTYSNTIKTPIVTVSNGINEVDWEDYRIPDSHGFYKNIGF